MDVIRIIVAYLAGINLLGFAAMGMDKWRAIRHAWRIPEVMLFLIALLGGSFGTFVAMHLFRHKIRRWYFLYGLPLILALQVIAGAYMIGSDRFVIM